MRVLHVIGGDLKYGASKGAFIWDQGEKELQNTVKELKMDIAQLSSSGRISNFARNELKMIPANPETLTIYINQFD